MLALWLPDKRAGWPSGALIAERVRRPPLAKRSLLAATVAMAGRLLPHRSALACMSSAVPSSPLSASSCGPRSRSCSVPSAAPGELRTSCGVPRVGPLRAAGSEVAAPALVRAHSAPELGPFLDDVGRAPGPWGLSHGLMV